jgi:hypothetical protein
MGNESIINISSENALVGIASRVRDSRKRSVTEAPHAGSHAYQGAFHRFTVSSIEDLNDSSENSVVRPRLAGSHLNKSARQMRAHRRVFIVSGRRNAA